MSKAAAEKFKGVFSFIATPTTDDGEAIDETRLLESIDFQIAHGVDGITVFGSTGGMGSFSETERRRVIEIAAKHIAGRVRFLPGTGSITTAEAIRLSKFAEGSGADGVLVVPINYWPATDNELYGHYEAIARSVKIPVGIYNNPATTGVDIKPALVARIAAIDNIGFIKESSGDMSRITAIRPANQKFVQAYYKRWNEYPPMEAEVGYTSLYLLKLAIEKANKLVGGWPDDEAIISQLEGLGWDSPAGYIQIRPDNHQGYKDAVTGFSKNVPDYPFPIWDPDRIITIRIRNITAPSHWPKPGTTHNDVTSAYNWIKTSWPTMKA